MTSQQVSISSSVPTETVMQPLTLHLTRGVFASTIDETRGMHDAFVDDESQPGREIARALGDLSHDVYTPARGVDPALRAQPGELLFSSREESEWAVAAEMILPSAGTASLVDLMAARVITTSLGGAPWRAGTLKPNPLGAANPRRAHGNTLAQAGAQAEVLAPDWWSTVDGLAEHYRDALTGGLPDALIGPAETAVWQQEAGFSEW
jgi:hypothetical protein